MWVGLLYIVITVAAYLALVVVSAVWWPIRTSPKPGRKLDLWVLDALTGGSINAVQIADNIYDETGGAVLADVFDVEKSLLLLSKRGAALRIDPEPEPVADDEPYEMPRYRITDSGSDLLELIERRGSGEQPGPTVAARLLSETASTASGAIALGTVAVIGPAALGVLVWPWLAVTALPLIMITWRLSPTLPFPQDVYLRRGVGVGVLLCVAGLYTATLPVT